MHDYYYRANQDGTTDSICIACFCTVVTARLFQQLKAAEQNHRCVRKMNASKPTGQRPAYWPIR